ncbi:unnamed protein product [Clonostachys rhizophaga]|uniref:Uncharacterized protein n=1 Tax=Clonostachys rhizophaga TaxID=160324 RepID=A0A9N9W3Y0_9HYPO|nr:unnamed protein product [Clonostachys rhizophaga]
MKIASTIAVASQAAQLDDGEKLLFGRDALEEARAQISAEDTYSGYFQPRSDIVFVRDYDARTNEPLFTAAMIGDKKSQREAKRVKKSKGKLGKKSKSKHAE